MQAYVNIIPRMVGLFDNVLIRLNHPACGGIVDPPVLMVKTPFCRF